jgi:hypothetical protein
MGGSSLDGDEEYAELLFDDVAEKRVSSDFKVSVGTFSFRISLLLSLLVFVKDVEGEIVVSGSELNEELFSEEDAFTIFVGCSFGWECIGLYGLNGWLV